MLKISRESEINIINMLIDQDIISGKDLPKIKQAIVLFDNFYLTNRGLFSPKPIFCTFEITGATVTLFDFIW